MRANPRMRICPAAHTHAHIRIYTHAHACTHVYTHAKEIFWQQICSTALSNRVPSSVRHHSLLLSNHCTIHIHIVTALAAQSVQTVIICHSFTSIFQLSTKPFNHLSHISHLLSLPPIISNSQSTHHIPSLSNVQSNHLLTILSICQSVTKPCQFSIYLPHFPSAFSYTTDFYSINLTIIIFIMETVFRANHQQFQLCIIIHLLIFVMKFVWNRFV